MPRAIAVEVIATKILEVRGKRVMLDRDLAVLYGVSVKVLNQAVRRNIKRFPEDFLFRLSWKEALSSRSQIVTLKQGQNIKYLPYAFTEQGVAMLSSVLNSERAIQVNVMIMRAFVKLRLILTSQDKLIYKLKELEDRLEGHDADIHDIFEAIRQLAGIPAERQVIRGFARK